MARKAPISYAAVEIEPLPTAPMEAVPVPAPPVSQGSKRGRPPAKQTLREAASPVILYPVSYTHLTLPTSDLV